MLKEMDRIIAQADGPTEEQLKLAANQLLNRQFLFREKAKQRRHYELVIEYPRYFEGLMEAVGYRLVNQEGEGCVGILPENFVRYMSLSETLMLLVLRYCYDEEIKAFNVGEFGEVSLRLDEFELRYEQLTGRDKPKTLGELESLLEPFARVGAVSLEKDEDAPEIRILKLSPVLTSLVNGEALIQLQAYIQAHDVEVAEGEETDGSQAVPSGGEQPRVSQ